MRTADEIWTLGRMLATAGISLSNPRAHVALRAYEAGEDPENCVETAVKHEASARQIWLDTTLDPWCRRHGITREQGLSIAFHDHAFDPANPDKDQVTFKDIFAWGGQANDFESSLVREAGPVVKASVADVPRGENMSKVTIGFVQADGDISVLATLNNADGNLTQAEFNTLIDWVKLSFKDACTNLDVQIFERADAPDYVTPDAAVVMRTSDELKSPVDGESHDKNISKVATDKKMDSLAILGVLAQVQGPCSVNEGVLWLEDGTSLDVGAAAKNQSQYLSELRLAGYAVVTFSPAELGTASAKSLEKRLIELGNEAISDLQEPVWGEQLGEQEQGGMTNAQKIEKREVLADAEFSQYDFGDGVTVSESDNWDCSDVADFTKIVYITCDGDAPDADSERVSFHVHFNTDGTVDDAYGLLMSNGSEIGMRPTEKNAAQAADDQEFPVVEITYTAEQRDRLGALFKEYLLRDVGPEKLLEITVLNINEPNPSICHSHDFIDSNVTMIDAFTEVMAFEPDGRSNTQMKLWGEAWGLAMEAMKNELSPSGESERLAQSKIDPLVVNGDASLAAAKKSDESNAPAP